MKRWRTRLVVIFALALLCGCGGVETVTGSELSARRQQEKGAGWYYTGSSDRYDFFSAVTAEGVKKFRAPLGEVQLNQRFPPTGERDKWVVLP